MSLAARLTALGFALGSAAHATGWVLLWWGIELYGAGYPAWRHVAFVLIDASIAWIAVRRPRWLVFVLVAFLIEQIWDHGVEPVGVLVMLAVLCAGWERGCARGSSAPARQARGSRPS